MKRSSVVLSALVVATLVAWSCGGGSSVTGSSQAPTPGTITANPNPALVSLQPVTLTAQGASDPSGRALTYAWNFGDGGTGSGQTVTHEYNNAGTFTVTLQVSNGQSNAATATTNVTVRSLSGSWSGSFENGLFNCSMNPIQSGAALSGTFTVNMPWPSSGPINGSVGCSGASCNMTLRAEIPDGALVVITAAAIDASLNRISGPGTLTLEGFGSRSGTYDFTRQ